MKRHSFGIRCRGAALLLAVLVVSNASRATEDGRIRPYEKNSFYWQYQGQPILLLGGSDDDNLFQWPEAALRRQLDTLRAAGGNYVRNTMSSRDEGNVQPFLQLPDGRYDLDRWNPDYWERFERFLRMTGERQIIVQIELWDPWDTYAEQWARSPWNPQNTISCSNEETRLARAYPRPQYRDGTSVGKPHDFFLTPPELQNDRAVLSRQQRLVREVLGRSLEHPHVLYCITNEIHPQYPPEWGWYWARFLRQQAAAADRQVAITEMYWSLDLRGPQHRASLNRPDVYGFFEASQNSGTRDPRANWENLQYVRESLARQPRPINHTKIYGADTGPAWADSQQVALECFWRNLIGGSASSRFHRPPTGIGLSDTAQQHLRSARMLSQAFDFFRAEPDSRHRLLGQRDANEAYLSSVPGEQYAVYFPSGGAVELDLRGAAGDFTLRWLEVAASRWTDRQKVAGETRLRLQTPAQGHWIAVIQIDKN